MNIYAAYPDKNGTAYTTDLNDDLENEYIENVMNPLHQGAFPTNKKISATVIQSLGNAEFRVGLSNWMHKSGLSTAEQKGRIEAVKRIIDAHNNMLKGTALSALGIKHQYSSLDLSNLGLTELPDQFWELSRLQKLNLSNNKFVNLPKQIGRFKHLKVLDIRKYGPLGDHFDPNIVGYAYGHRRSFVNRERWLDKYFMKSDCLIITTNRCETVGDIRVRIDAEQRERHHNAFDIPDVPEARPGVATSPPLF